ncbi:hypothetical protein NZK33_03645, partial [Cyanobium sp. FGCU-6]|nr:hypothetical protein [Cyanobium sp. FGCU6]
MKQILSPNHYNCQWMNWIKRQGRIAIGVHNDRCLRGKRGQHNGCPSNDSSENAFMEFPGKYLGPAEKPRTVAPQLIPAG